jgi:hypothetical protein
MLGDGAIRALGGSACCDSGKKCDRIAQHQLFRMMVPVFYQYIGARKPRQVPAAAIFEYG